MSVILSLLLAAMPQTTDGKAETATTPAPVPPSERRICKRTVDTGSLVRGRKECRTKSEWDKLAWAARLNGEDIIQRNAGQPGGN